MTLVVENNTFSVFANGKYIASASDRELGFGDLGLAVFSGTNTDFGFRCQMTNVELWEIK